MTFKALGKRVWFLFIPVLFLWMPVNDFSKIKQVSLNSLTIGAFTSSIILLVNIFFVHYRLNDGLVIDASILDYYHTGFQFTSVLDMHPTYLGMYTLLALAYVIIEKPFKQKWATITLILILLISILFIASRVAYFLTFVLFFLKGIKFLSEKIRYKPRVGILYVFGLLIITTGAVKLLSTTYIGYRLSKETYWDLTSEHFNQENLINKQDSRLARWKVAIDLIKERPFLGYGAGTEKSHLVQKYKENEMNIAAENQYGAHNQFLSYFLEFGIIGILYFAFFLFINIFYSLKAKHFLAAFFFFSLSISSLFENIIYNHAGVIFVAFFTPLFTYLSWYKLKASNND
ncbi:O-antigen ligase family protein [Psychroflexus planctonicus]|nr:O-antigen ligase family protein [Psychroflexus planctonicus]